MKKTWANRIISAVSLVMTAAFIFTGCSSSPAGQSSIAASSAAGSSAASGEKTMVFIINSDAGNTFNPFTINDRNKVAVSTPMLSPVYRTKADGSLVPILAESITPSEDGLTYTLKLKSGLKWSDGQPITADDVVFYYTTLNNLSPQYYIGGQPFTAEKKDDLTVTFKLPSKSASFQEMLWYNLFLAPKHVYDGKDNYDVNMLQEKVVGSGAYVFDEYSTGEYYKYKANPNYAGGKPSIDNLVYRIISNDETAAYAMLNGEANAWVVPSEYIDKFTNNDEFNLRSFSTNSVHYLQLNRVADSMQKKDYRAGLLKALNRKEILDAGYGSEDRYEINASCLPKSNPYHSEDIEKYDQDIEEAKKLTQGGATTLKLAYIAGRDYNKREALVVQAELEKIGIKVEIFELDSAAYMAASYDPTNKEYDMYLCTYIMGNDPEMYSCLFDPSTGNYLNFNNDEIVKTFAEGRDTLDTGKRTEIYKKAQKLVAEEALIYPLGSDKSVLVTSKNIVGADKADLHPMQLFQDYTQLSMK